MNVRQKLLSGLVIPAHPLALTAERNLDERRQRALTRYYLAAGAGGIAVGVHTTQFAIREHGMLRSVLELAAEEARATRRCWPTRVPLPPSSRCLDSTSSRPSAAGRSRSASGAASRRSPTWS